jgi:carbon monoxide dehydrogenase subunit G
MKVEKSFTIDVSPEQLCAAMRDPGLIQQEEKMRGTLNVDITDLEQTDETHRFMIKAETYSRSLTGVDKSKTEINETTVTWNLNSTSSSWTWKGSNPQANKAKVDGGSLLKAKGDGTEITLFLNIDIPVPLIGGKISKIVAKKFQEAWPNYVAAATAWAKKSD